MLVISRLRADCPFSDAQSISLPQPPPPSPHYPLVRIHQRTDPLIRHLASLQLVPLPQVGCRAQSRWLEIDVHVLPVSLVRLEDLMHEADIVMLLDGAIPPFDGFLVQRAVGVGVHVVEGAPVGDEDELSGGARVFGCIAGLAEDWRSVSIKQEVNRRGHSHPVSSPLVSRLATMPDMYSFTLGKSGANIPSGWLHFAPRSRMATFSCPGSGNWPSRLKTCAVVLPGSTPSRYGFFLGP